jgi:signal transduction histidine kinase
VAVPIIHGRDRFGAIVLSIPKNVPFTQQKEAFLNLFAVQAAIAIRNARAYEEEKHAGQQLRDLHQYLERAREAERARISREIHDELGQRLTALKMDTAWVARRVGDPPRGVQQKLQDMLALIDETIHDVRRVATDLRPGLLDDLGLAAAIEWKLNDFSTRNQIPCSSQLDDVAVEIDETTAIAIYRIFQETLTNIARHAQASQVEVQLRNLGDELHLRVRDDGIGMTSEQIQDDHSLGLLGMRERAYTIGADFQITSIPKKGTQIFLRIPVKFTGEGETIND